MVRFDAQDGESWAGRIRAMPWEPGAELEFRVGRVARGCFDPHLRHPARLRRALDAVCAPAVLRLEDARYPGGIRRRTCAGETTWVRKRSTRTIDFAWLPEVVLRASLSREEPVPPMADARPLAVLERTRYAYAVIPGWRVDLTVATASAARLEIEYTGDDYARSEPLESLFRILHALPWDPALRVDPTTLETAPVPEVAAWAREVVGASRPGFPGAQPVALETAHLAAVRTARYQVSSKIDGERAFFVAVGLGARFARLPAELRLLLTPRFVGLMDRAMRFTWVPLLGAHRLALGTLLDVERVPSGPSIVAFDGMAEGGECLAQLPLARRLEAVGRVVADLGTSRAWAFVQKPFWPVVRIREAVGAAVTWEQDGLIFTPEGPYSPHVNLDMFKYKPMSKLSVDFRLGEAAADEGFPLRVKRGEEEVVFGHARLDAASRARISTPIVECTLVDGAWRVYRLRPDKTHPNTLRAAQSTLRALRSGLTLGALVAQLG